MANVRKVKTEFEGRVYEESIVVEGEGLSAWEAGAGLKFVGHGKTRVDGAERVSGLAQFTSDIQLPGMLYGKTLRSPYPHARIKNIQIAAAQKIPGVRAVLSYLNIPRMPFF